jgi:hypothetical protein
MSHQGDIVGLIEHCVTLFRMALAPVCPSALISLHGISRS